MYLSIKEKGKTLWTHSSLVPDERAHAIQKLQEGRCGFRNKDTFISTYLALELVNRFAPLKRKSFLIRSGIVAGTALTAW